MNTVSTNTSPSVHSAKKTWVPMGMAVTLLVGIAAGGLGVRWFSSKPETPPEIARPGIASAETSESPGAESASELRFSPALWESAGIRIGQASLGTLGKSLRLTGKVSLNEDRIAHIYPMIEGTVDEVSVSLGQTVQSDDLLVIIHSRDVGKAKLELYQARLQLEMARVKDGMQREITDNARELLTALRGGKSIADIETQFRLRGMGDYRERLLLAYSNYLKSQADLDRLESISDSGVISSKQLMAARSARNADQATYQARLEQIEYELTTALLLSSQSVREADTRVAVAATDLRILGCDPEDIATIDPASQGEAISHYPIRAPFEGTIITKDVVLREHVRPDLQILSIADLASVWITADVYESNIPLLSHLAGTEIQVHSEAWPDRSFSARVFYAGEIIQESSRTIAMRAVAANPEHLLKPGMFVTIYLPSNSEKNALLVPSSAVQEHQGIKFLFVRTGEDAFERRDVVVGESNQQSTAIEKGLREGESVVVEGGFVLKSKLLADLLGEE